MARVLFLMERGLKVINLMTMLCLWLLLCLYLAFKMAERNSMIGALPAAVDVSGVEWIAGQSDFREGCGVAVFRLAPAFSQRLRDHGLQALEEAVQGRGYADRYYYHYAPWRITPSNDGNGDGGWSGMRCGDVPQALEQRIYQGLRSPGGYITDKSEGALLVLPAEGLVVFAYDG